MEARGDGIVAIMTTTGIAAELTPEPVELPLQRVAPDDDLFVKQHPAAPGMWLPVH